MAKFTSKTKNYTVLTSAGKAEFVDAVFTTVNKNLISRLRSLSIYGKEIKEEKPVSDKD